MRKHLLTAIALMGLLPAFPALAEPVSLVCHYKIPQIAEDGASIIDLDEAQASVTVHFSSFQAQGFITHTNARVLGPTHAAFGAQEISFQDPSASSGPNGGPDKLVLNRLTGELSGEWATDSMTCQAAAKKF